MFWPLMKDCITEEDKNSMVDFIRSTNRFTNGPRVKEFESLWSDWLGTRYSLFVSSGSAANLLLAASVKELYGLQSGDKVLVPAMTWVTNVAPIIQLGLEPIFCDVDPTHFSFDTRHMEYLAKKHPDIKLVFVSHLFGFTAPIDEYKKILPKALFMEDVCESHGAKAGDKKAGTLSVGSTFSFYFGHHMTTIEGGFVCTSNKDLYELMKAKRSHGMARECSPDLYEKYKSENPDVHEQFLFITDGYNLRNVELNAVLGISQLKSLDNNIRERISNLKRFVDICNKHDSLIVSFKMEGNSSFCLPFIVKDREIKQKLETHLQSNGIETRPLCSGNLLRQPFLKKDYQMDIPWESNIEFLHHNGFFIGNNHMITSEEFDKLSEIIDNFFNISKGG
tara:strand:+ start:3072 stop:4250 length:1179 start_codon:yes stop_codon:yes gene_type:complete